MIWQTFGDHIWGMEAKDRFVCGEKGFVGAKLGLTDDSVGDIHGVEPGSSSHFLLESCISGRAVSGPWVAYVTYTRVPGGDDCPHITTSTTR